MSSPQLFEIPLLVWERASCLVLWLPEECKVIYRIRKKDAFVVPDTVQFHELVSHFHLTC